MNLTHLVTIKHASILYKYVSCPIYCNYFKDIHIDIIEEIFWCHSFNDKYVYFQNTMHNSKTIKEYGTTLLHFLQNYNNYDLIDYKNNKIYILTTKYR